MLFCTITAYDHLWIPFPDSSVGKESACSAKDPSSSPWSGRSAGEGIDYSFQYSWASLVAQLVKTLPAMQETWVWSLGWEDLLKKGKVTHSSILAWRISWTVSMGSQRVGHNWVTFTFYFFSPMKFFLLIPSHFSFFINISLQCDELSFLTLDIFDLSFNVSLASLLQILRSSQG